MARLPLPVAAALATLVVGTAPAWAVVVEAAAALMAVSYGAGEAGKQFRSSIDHAEAAAKRVADYGIEKSGDMLEARIDQIEVVLNELGENLIVQGSDAAEQLMASAAVQISAIEDNLVGDLAGLIFQVECASKRVTVKQLPDLAGWPGRLLGLNQTEISPPIGPWLPEGSQTRTSYVVELKDPYSNTVAEIAGIYVASLAGDNVTDETPAHAILATYEALSDIYRTATCLEQAGAQRYARKSVEYGEMAQAWENLVDIDPVVILPK